MDFRSRFLAVVLMMVAAVPWVAAQEAQPAALPTPYPTTQLTIDVWPRDPEKFAAGEVSQGNLDGIQIEIYNADATESVVSDGYRYHQYEIPQRVPVNTPALFRITDPVLDKAMLSYTAWEGSYPPRLKFTYPRPGGMGAMRLVDDDYNCDHLTRPYRIDVECLCNVAESILEGALYRRLDVGTAPQLCVEYLPGNAQYPLPPESFVGSEASSYLFLAFVLPEAKLQMLKGTYVERDGDLPQGLVRLSEAFSGYTTSTLVTSLSACDLQQWTALIAPDGSDPDAISPTDEPPDRYFPFPPPDVYTHMARRELLLGRSIPFGYLKKAIDPDGTRIFDAASAMDQETTGTITTEPMLSLEDVSVAPGGSATLHLRLSGAVEDTLAFNATLSFSGVTTETLALLTVHGVPSAALAGGDFDEYQFLRHDGTLEYRFFARAAVPFDARDGVDVAEITVDVPQVVALGSVIDVEVRSGVEDQAMLSSVVDEGLHLVGPEVVGRGARLYVDKAPVTGWRIE